jgi:hypothetical protein
MEDLSMRSKHLLMSLGLTLLTVSGSPVLAAATGHGLTAGQIQKVKNLGLKLVVPGYLPAGFKLTKFEADKSSGADDKLVPFYNLIYRGPGQQEFYLCGGQTCSWGADNTGAAKVAVSNPLFSPLTLFRYKKNAVFSYNTAHAMTLKGGTNYEYGSPYADADETKMSPVSEAESAKIIQGLKLL